MSTHLHRLSASSLIAALTLAALALALPTEANAKRKSHDRREPVVLESFREDLFTNSNRKVLESQDRGAHIIYDWSYQETVLDRDAVEGTVAKPERIDTEVARFRRDHILTLGQSQIETIQVGEIKNANFAVVFVHGGGGANKDIGGSDVNFGANFNHVQSLAARNGGVYLSPTFALSAQGDPRIPELISFLAKQTAPGAKIILACGSAGAYACWQAAVSNEGSKLGGMILLGGSSFDINFLKSDAARSGVPVLFSHGTKDPLVPLAYANQAYQAVRSLGSRYPVRFEAFNGGKHGTPIRLVDWKATLEWMINQ